MKITKISKPDKSTYSKQSNVIRKTSNKSISFDKIILASDSDCLFEDTEILTREGYKKISEIDYFDDILTHDNTYKKIVSVIEKKFDTAKLIMLSNNATILASYNHQLISDKNLPIKARNIKIGDGLKYFSEYYNKRTDGNITVKNINRISIDTSKHSFYDIEVEDNHTFYIKCGDLNVLSHNCDGSHICGIMLGTFMRFAENLFNEGKICRLKTPVIILKDKKEHIKEYFFTVIEFQKWEDKNPNWNKSLTLKYIKGLGSWKKSELQEIINKEGLDHFIEEFDLNHISKDLINTWLKNDKSDARKDLMRNGKLDMNSI